MRLNKPFTNKDYADFAIYCNNNDCHIEDKGDWLESIKNTHEVEELTKEEISEKRRFLYILKKDPLTCQIQALRDEPQTEEILNEIESLQEERKRVVEKIKNENPYPVG